MAAPGIVAVERMMRLDVLSVYPVERTPIAKELISKVVEFAMTSGVVAGLMAPVHCALEVELSPTGEARYPHLLAFQAPGARFADSVAEDLRALVGDLLSHPSLSDLYITRVVFRECAAAGVTETGEESCRSQ